MIKQWSTDLLIYGKHVSRLSNQLINKVKKYKLHIYKGFDYFYIGRRWEEIKEDETPEKFEQVINAKINKIFNANIKCDTYFQDERFY